MNIFKVSVIGINVVNFIDNNGNVLLAKDLYMDEDGDVFVVKPDTKLVHIDDVVAMYTIEDDTVYYCAIRPTSVFIRQMSLSEASKHKLIGECINKTSPLKLSIDNGLLSISIGVDILTFATGYGLSHHNDDDFKITDNEKFTQNILNHLLSEKEDGTTLVHEMFDKAALKALEAGDVEGTSLWDDD